MTVRSGLLVFPVTAAASLLAAARPLAASDWPQFRGPDGTGISPEKGISRDWRARPPRELWRVALSDGGFAGPSAAKGRAFIIDHQGDQDVVRSFDLGSGTELWRTQYADLGKADKGFSRATPSVDSDRVYTVSYLGRLHCIDVAKGLVLWQADFQTMGDARPRWGHSASALVDGSRIVVQTGGANLLAAFDKHTGKVVMRGGGSETAGYATPVAATLAGRRQYVVFASRSAVGVDAATGARLWSVPWQTNFDVNAATPLVVGARHVFVTSGYGRGSALLEVSASGARIAWESKEIQSHFSTGIVSGSHVFSTTDPGRLVCLDTRTGSVAWERQGFEKGGLVGVDGSLIVMDGKTGEVALVAMDVAGCRELGRVKPLGGKSWTAPVVADMKLLVRNAGALACLDLK